MDNKGVELNKLIKQLEDLQIRQEAVIKKIRQVSSTEEAQAADRSTASAPQETDTPFRVGQRVLIKNKLGQILGRRPSIKDRAGTVTRLTKKRVHIKTCNDNDTSRAPHNIISLSQQEYEEILKNA